MGHVSHPYRECYRTLPDVVCIAYDILQLQIIIIAQSYCRIIASAKSRLKFITMRVDSLDLSFEQHLPEILLDLANYKYQHLIQHSLLLLDRYFSSQSDIFNKALQTQLLLTPQSIQFYNTIEKLFIDLMAFLRSGSGAVNTGQDPSPVEVLTEHCWLEAEVEGFEPHQVNQNIILSFGMGI